MGAYAPISHYERTTFASIGGRSRSAQASKSTFALELSSLGENECCPNAGAPHGESRDGHERQKSPQAFIERLFGSIAKRDILKKSIQSKNMGSFSPLIILDHREFQSEEKELQSQLERFIRGEEAGITQQPHAFFGHMTPIEWVRLQYIHSDHHLNQFGV